MKKIIANFGPGPCYVEPRVLDAFDNAGYGEEGFMGTGIPIGSTSHRSKTFLDNVLKPLNELTRELLEIPDNYSILWTRDGATEQWTRIARNFSSSLIKRHSEGFARRILWWWNFIPKVRSFIAQRALNDGLSYS